MLTGCSASYTGERLFWKAQQLNQAIVKDPDRATPKQLAAAIAAFSRVIEQTPQTIWAARAQASIGTLYAIRKEYSKAREAYGLVLTNYNQYRELGLTARFATARTYELEQSWDAAVKEYRELADRYPWTVLGLEVPLYVARIYEQRGEPERAKDAYERAVRFYTRLIPAAPTPELGVRAKGFLVLMHEQLGDWEQAARVLEELAVAPTGVDQPRILWTLATIHRSKLGNPQKAEALSRRLLQEFPDHALSQRAREQLAQLGVSVPAATAPPVAEEATSSAVPSTSAVVAR